MFIFERESGGGAERERETDRQTEVPKQTLCWEQRREPAVGLKLQIRLSWPERKSWRLTDWATQSLPGICILNKNPNDSDAGDFDLHVEKH